MNSKHRKKKFNTELNTIDVQGMWVPTREKSGQKRFCIPLQITASDFRRLKKSGM